MLSDSMHYTAVFDEFNCGILGEFNMDNKFLSAFKGELDTNEIIDVKVPAIYFQHIKQMAELETKEAEKREKKKRQRELCLAIALLIVLILIALKGINQIITDIETHRGLQCYIEQLHYML